MNNLREWQNKIREQEEKRIGDVRTECEKLGCHRDYVKAFITRAELFPMEQTLSFLENRAENKEKLRQWEVLLRVLIEKKPNHEKSEEWKLSLEAMRK